MFTTCTTNQGGRRTTRWEHDGVLDEMQERMKRNRATFRRRRSIVEHPCGTMNCGMQQSFVLMRGNEQVAAEISLTVLRYTVTRVRTMLGSEKWTPQVRNPRYKGRLRQVIAKTVKTLVRRQKYEKNKRKEDEHDGTNGHCSVTNALQHGSGGVSGSVSDFSHSLCACSAAFQETITRFMYN